MLGGLEWRIRRHIKRRGAGEFDIPGLIRIEKVRKAATRKRMGRNPRTGGQIQIPAKPAHYDIRVSVSSRLENMTL